MTSGVNIIEMHETIKKVYSYVIGKKKKKKELTPCDKLIN